MTSKQKTVTVIGAGALGSHVVQFLRNEDARIRVVDYDRIEQKNVQAQFHSKPNVGKLKVNALGQTMQFLYGIKLETVPFRLIEDNVAPLLHGDLVLDCLDNAESREILQRHVREKGIPCLHGALAPDGQFGRVVWDNAFQIDSEVGYGEVTCEGGDFLPFIAMVSACLARSAQLYLREGKLVGYAITPTGVFCL